MMSAYLSKLRGRGDMTAQAIDKIASRPTKGKPEQGVRAEQDHYDALARMVAEVSQDHAQLRKFIYEFARVKLRKDLYPRFVEGAWSEIEDQVRGLEAAIDRIEVGFAQSAPHLQNFLPPPPDQSQEHIAQNLAVPSIGLQTTTRFGETAISIGSLAGARQYGRPPPGITFGANDRFANAYLGNHLRSRFWWNVQLILAAAIGVAIYATIDADSVLSRLRLHTWIKPAQVSAVDEVEKAQHVSLAKNELGTTPAAPLQRRDSDVPIPTDYGVYAVSDGSLVELEQLPIRVPDGRVGISAPISTTSKTQLASNQFRFVVFRRDLANSAPDRIMIRVIARVMRALTFDRRGAAKMTDVDQTWVIRDKSYEMKVAPLADNPEMIVVRPEPTDYVFPAGRYALVLNGIGYDFTVVGSPTDLAHCLERTDVTGAPVYSECPK